MRKTILYIATSLDGFIAGLNDELDWLEIADNDKHPWTKFYNSIDTTVMGGSTYRVVLGFGESIYPDKTNYIYSRKKTKGEAENNIFFREPVSTLVRKLKRRKGKHIFIVGEAVLSTR